MNFSEEVVKNYLEKKGHHVSRGRFNEPDFLIDDEFFVEVKNRYATSSYWLNLNQEVNFSKIKKDIWIYLVYGKIIKYKMKFKPLIRR